MADFRIAQQIVGLSEGGYQNDPRDTGNYYQGQLIGTNWGISAPTLGRYLGRIPTKAEMLNLSQKTAEEILKVNYWLKNNLNQIKNQSVANLLYDGVVNHGSNGMRFLVEKALRILKRPLSYHEVFTTKGIKHLNAFKAKILFYEVKKVRAHQYKSSSQKHFVKGWLNRLEKIKYYPNNTLSGIWPLAVLFIGICLLVITI